MKAWATVFFLWLVAFNLEAENTYEIAGRVLINEEGVLHIYLVDEDQFSVPFTGIKEFIVPVSPAQLDSGTAPFAFQDIPAGRCGIRVFIDTNDNGKLDRGLFGPSEPWGMSWQRKRISRIPRFNDIAFQLIGDIRGLEIDSCRE
jgi:uncharacterized protein (DUF2141 family)